MMLRSLSALSLIAALGLSSVASAAPCEATPAVRVVNAHPGRFLQHRRFAERVRLQPREGRPLIFHRGPYSHRGIRFVPMRHGLRAHGYRGR